MLRSTVASWLPNQAQPAELVAGASDRCCWGSSACEVRLCATSSGRRLHGSKLASAGAVCVSPAPAGEAEELPDSWAFLDASCPGEGADAPADDMLEAPPAEPHALIAGAAM